MYCFAARISVLASPKKTIPMTYVLKLRLEKMKKSVTNTTMKVTMYELSTSSNCTKVCLNVKNSRTQPFCSDARELYNYYGSFDRQGIWEFNLTVTTDCIPKIRLWMELDGE